MKQVEKIDVFLTMQEDEFVVTLTVAGDARTLPVTIGRLEAQSIAMQLYKVDFPRPLSHDLMKAVVTALGGEITRVDIVAVIDGTFIARIFVKQGDTTFDFDARPSDALALAIRFSAPVFINDSVLDDSGVIIKNEPAMKRMDDAVVPPASVSKASPQSEQSLADQLDTAIREERYEEAARLRDEIKKTSAAN